MTTATMADSTTGMPAPTRTELVSLDKIDRDPRVNTREIDQGWVKARIPKFRAQALGTFAISLRADGTMIVLDGQNRIALCKAVGYGPGHMCVIYEGLDLAQEAGLFVLLNDARAVRPGARFKALVTQGDETACAILRAAQLASWEIDVIGGPGVVTAVSTLERLWRNDRKHFQHEDPFVVANTLQVIAQAWAHADKAQDAAIIGGIGMLFVRDGIRDAGHGGAIDASRMGARLATIEGGPPELLAKAKGLQRVYGGALAVSVAELVVKDYNTGLPQGKRLTKVR